MPETAGGDGETRRDPTTEMAAERTMLAWIRTGLALMGFGFVVAKFGLFLRKLSELRGLHSTVPKNQSMSLWIGVALVLLGVVVNVTAAIRFARLIRRLGRGQLPATASWKSALIVAVIMACIGVAIASYLVRLG